jgi:soluble lytic murein transglycosylase-like protein
MSSALIQWEQEQKRRWRRFLGMIWAGVGSPMRGLLLGGLAFVLGIYAASPTTGTGADAFVGKRLRDTEVTLKARQGELELARLELARVHTIMRYSSQYRIPADLATKIYDIALAEGIDPGLAYRLVRVESGFYGGAISPVGAVGLTQVMPATARELDPTLAYADLFHQETNLRLGFRYLRLMLEKYQGDMRLALLAYNRGPGTVDRIRQVGGDPANGYEVAVMGSSH